jgi:hypothetical protein
MSVEPSYSLHYETQQWVGSFDDDLAVNTYGERYVYGTMNQNTVSANIRVNWTFTPKISLQLFVQPLFSVGEYSNFKELEKPSSMKYHTYNNNGGTVRYNSEEDEYTIDPDGNGNAESFSFGNPDFNFKSLRGNLVLRWEVTPGSVFYLVWTHDKTNFDHPGSFDISRDFNNLWNATSNNVLMAKFNYWFNVGF